MAHNLTLVLPRPKVTIHTNRKLYLAAAMIEVPEIVFWYLLTSALDSSMAMWLLPTFTSCLILFLFCVV